MRHFIHSGDLGDVLYALPTVRAMGGGTIHLIDSPGMTAHGMTPERIAAIQPLLESQPYISEVRTDFPVEGMDEVNLNAFRFSGQDFVSTFLPDTTLNTFRLPVTERDTKWLTADPYHSKESGMAAPVILARSARYHNPRFPWRKILEKYGRDALFVGTPAEYVAFNTEFGSSLNFKYTGDLLHLARVIASADLFIGNQSAPLAIAHGLKQNAIVEVCPYCPNCIDPRLNCWPGFDENVHLPDLECLVRGVYPAI
jgi:hypothetical protein